MFSFIKSLFGKKEKIEQKDKEYEELDINELYKNHINNIEKKYGSLQKYIIELSKKAKKELENDERYMYLKKMSEDAVQKALNASIKHNKDEKRKQELLSAINSKPRKKEVNDVIYLAKIAHDYYWRDGDTIYTFLDRIYESKKILIEYSEVSKNIYQRDGYNIITLPYGCISSVLSIARNLAVMFMNITPIKRYDGTCIFDKNDIRLINIFSTELIMPTELFIDKCVEYEDDISRLAGFFCVNSMDICIRRYNLGLTDVIENPNYTSYD